jgi:hypothetical protein
VKKKKTRRNRKRDFPAVCRRYGDFDVALRQVGATRAEFDEWMKDPCFVERLKEAIDSEPPYESADGLLLSAKELPFFNWYRKDMTYPIAKKVATLPEKERKAFFQRYRDAETKDDLTFNYRGRKVTLTYKYIRDFRKKLESKVKKCLSGRFKPGFYSKKDRRIAELICDKSLTDRQRAKKAGMNLGAFKTRKSAWMKNIASLSSH